MPEDVVIREQRPCNFVSVKYVSELLNVDMQHNLKLAPHLRQAALQHSSHFEKMKVGLARAIINQEVAAALEYLVHTKQMEMNALTTAWFLKTMHHWFRLMSSRLSKVAMSHFDTKKHEETTAL